MMFIGGALLIIGIALKFFKVSFNIFKLFRKKGKKSKGKESDLTKEDIRAAVREELDKGTKKKVAKAAKKTKKKLKKAEKGYKDLTKKR